MDRTNEMSFGGQFHTIGVRPTSPALGSSHLNQTIATVSPRYMVPLSQKPFSSQF